jgi:hypothetical protein
MTWRQDQRLSFAARGVLHLLLEDPATATVDTVAEHCVGEHRQSVCRMLQELARYGYVRVDAPAGPFTWGSERIQAAAEPVPEWAATKVVRLGFDPDTRRRAPIPPIAIPEGPA